MPQGGVQALEAMLYTLDILNEREIVRRQDRAHILDDCDKDTYGLEMARPLSSVKRSTHTGASPYAHASLSHSRWTDSQSVSQGDPSMAHA
ncbi:hypothetical protein DMN91_012236 [Ooceraea biroi]|uniref:Uncharacterized protein n=1 Tax=Ooceraea biroi TaxID=2015173 RepID=A0A3L8D413_OOCBI|nr:hypothetical protein DMN91_012236 [Ooceraea biroi]